MRDEGSRRIEARDLRSGHSLNQHVMSGRYPVDTALKGLLPNPHVAARHILTMWRIVRPSCSASKPSLISSRLPELVQSLSTANRPR